MLLKLEPSKLHTLLAELDLDSSAVSDKMSKKDKKKGGRRGRKKKEIIDIRQ